MKNENNPSVTSVSGGKTSAYLAKHYPTDYNIFSLVRIEDRNCAPKDKKLVQIISDKIGMEFIATAESDKTLKVVLDLEQILGKEIIWVTGKSFEEVIRSKKAIPNMMWRFCTTEMKMKPIFDYTQKFIGFVDMQIGIRYDEEHRARENNTFKTIIGKHENGRNKWAEIEWRNSMFPLVENKITHFQVKQWADSTDLIFPPDSNCVGCFWKPIQQLRKNWEDEPLKMQWFSKMENEMNRTFKKEMKYEKIKNIGLQTEFFFGTGSGCQAGFCTD